MADDRWRQVSAVYHAALAHDGAVRAAFLAEACQGDDTLRREEKVLDGFFRGDWLVRPEGPGTWIVSSDTDDRGFRLIDVEQRGVVWDERRPGVGGGLPMFSADGRKISIPIRQSRTRDAVWVFDTATHQGRVAATLPFHVVFRAAWADNGRAFIVNRNETVRHIVMFDHFWSTDREQ